MAEEKNKQYHGDDKHLDEVRRCIIQNLEEAIEDLEDAGEKCELSLVDRNSKEWHNSAFD